MYFYDVLRGGCIAPTTHTCKGFNCLTGNLHPQKVCTILYSAPITRRLMILNVL